MTEWRHKKRGDTHTWPSNNKMMKKQKNKKKNYQLKKIVA